MLVVILFFPQLHQTAVVLGFFHLEQHLLQVALEEEVQLLQIMVQVGLERQDRAMTVGQENVVEQAECTLVEAAEVLLKLEAMAIMLH
jgi:hypothetical protein